MQHLQQLSVARIVARQQRVADGQDDVEAGEEGGGELDRRQHHGGLERGANRPGGAREGGRVVSAKGGAASPLPAPLPRGGGGRGAGRRKGGSETRERRLRVV